MSWVPRDFVRQVQNRSICHPSTMPLIDSQASASRTAGPDRCLVGFEGGAMDALAIVGVVALRDLQERGGVLPEHPLPIWPRGLPRLPLAASFAVDAAGPHLLRQFIS